MNTNVTRVLTTDAAGLYRVPDLVPGSYDVELSAPGFQSERRTGLNLSIGQVLTVNFSLRPGSVKETITVTEAGAGTVDTSTSTISDTVTTKEVQDLPLNGRDFTSLVGLAVGAQRDDNINNFYSGEYNLSGGRPEGNEFLVEGNDIEPAYANGITVKPNLEALSEFQVQTANFSAEYGRSLGGIVNAHIKSGTNQFHGSLFEYFRNNALNAVPLYQVNNPPLHYNQFGGSFGGPIVKDKLFVFADYQGTRILSSSTARYEIPTAAMTHPTNGFYDFSSVCTAGFTSGVCNNTGQQIYNPFDPARAPFQNNQIPASLADPTVALMFTYFPAPNCAGNLALCGSANFIATQPATTPQDSGDLRIDYHPTDKDQLGLSMLFIKTSLDQPSAFSPDLGSGLLTNKSSNFYRLGAISYSRVFSATLSNEFRIGIVIEHDDGPPGDGMQYEASLAGLGGLNTSPTNTQTTGFPLILDASTGTFFGGGAGGPFIGHVNIPQLSDNLTWIKGRHAFKSGFSLRFREYNALQSIFPRGFYVTDALETANSFVGGYGFASDLLGDPLAAQKQLNFQESGLRYREVGAYFQDDFKVTPRLMLNLGIRWDLYTAPTEVQNRLSNFDPTTVSLVFPGHGLSASTLKNNYRDFQPRFGFAYALTKDGKTALRGGYGIAFLPFVQASNNTLMANPPFSYSINNSDAANLFLPPGNSLISDGLPVIQPSNPATIAAGASINYIPTPQPTPYVQQWNLGVQRMLPHDIGVLEVAYVGTAGVHLNGGGINVNQWPAGTSSAASPISPNVGVVSAQLNNEQSIYHSLQVKVHRNFSAGLDLQAWWVFSRSIDDASFPSSQPQNSFDLAAERALSDFNATHKGAIGIVYELPFGTGKRYLNNNRALSTFIGGWQLNSIISAQTGNPLNVTYSVGDGGINAGPGGPVRPNIVGDPNKGGAVAANPSCSAPATVHNATAWFNPCAFVAPVNAYGNAGRNIIVGPGLFSMDTSLFKTFLPVGERFKVEFRGEFFNVLNHPYLGQPNMNFDAPSGSQQPGQIMSAGPGRVLQVALKLIF